MIGNGVVVDLEALLSELEELREAGVDVADRVLISESAHVVLPFQKQLDELQKKSKDFAKRSSNCKSRSINSKSKSN